MVRRRALREIPPKIHGVLEPRSLQKWPRVDLPTQLGFSEPKDPKWLNGGVTQWHKWRPTLRSWQDLNTQLQILTREVAVSD